MPDLNAKASLLKSRNPDADPAQWASMYEWQFTWFRVIAWAWQSEANYKMITEAGPDELKKFFKDVMKYPLPEHLELDIIPSDAEWIQSEDDSNTSTPGWGDLESMTLTIPLPKPPSDADAQAIALADFADSGRCYPFTCC